MTAIQTSAPAVEPVSLEEAKAFLRVDHVSEDALVQALIAAARTHVEALCGRKLIAQGWRVYVDALPEIGRIRLPVGPVLSVDAVTVYDGEGNGIELDAADYLVDAAGIPPRIAFRRRPAVLREMNGIEIDVTVGFGATSLDVPSPLRQAILDLVADWYDHRGTGLDTAMMREPDRVVALVEPYRAVLL